MVAWCRITSVVEFLSVLQGYLRGAPEMIKHLNPCNNSAPAAFGCPYEEWKQLETEFMLNGMFSFRMPYVSK